MTTETLNAPTTGADEMTSQQKTPRRRLKALLATGMVTGVAVVAVLAATSDTEYAKGSFEAGAFVLEGGIEASVESATYGFDLSGSAQDAREIEFSTPESGLGPNQSAYGAIWVRLDEETNTPASLTIPEVFGSGANANAMSWDVVSNGSPTASNCTSGEAFQRSSGVPNRVGSGPTFNAVNTGNGTVDLEPGAPGEPGRAVQLCFRVSAGNHNPADASSLQPNESAEATWTLSAFARD